MMTQDSSPGHGTTPVMAQFLDLKAAHPEALLFFRMGDFYELFFEDAGRAAAALDIALTKRGKHQDRDIPMCGVPVHSAEQYLLTLIRKGFRVAIAEQVEDPAEARKRGSKSVVRREVVRLVTPGTLTEDSLLDARRHNYLAALARLRGEVALAAADMSTGAFRVATIETSAIGAELARLGVRELLVTEAEAETLAPQLEGEGPSLTIRPATAFTSQAGEERLKRLFSVAALDGFGSFTRVELAAMGALVDYLELTQRGQLPVLSPPRREQAGTHMQIDAATRRNLELTETLSGRREGSLLAAIDRSVTAAGARLLATRLAAPSTEPGEIAARLDGVAFLAQQDDLRGDLRRILRRVPDLDRARARLALGRGGPRDLAAIAAGLTAAEDCAGPLAETGPPAALAHLLPHLSGHAALAGRLAGALVAEPPVSMADGGFIADGVDAGLDEARRLRDESRQVIAALQARYAEETAIASLKIRHNNVLGYFVETTATHEARMQAPPLSETFLYRQRTANTIRYATEELGALERRIEQAAADALAIERRLFDTLREAVLEEAGRIGEAAEALAAIDLAAGLADLARERDWCRPRVESGRAFTIEAGRHPAVEAALAASGAPFIANECELSAEGDAAAIRLVTGPNMAGKSTYLRQNALIAVLAQMGSFVPARSAHIGVVSQLFSRVGAADDLARGRSTFMVEMVETAAILNQADARALVILDEIGRGTATWDGLSIAWATVEHLHEVNRCRALFATHYHELTTLAERLPGLANLTAAVRDWENEVIFLHEIRPGAADRSYGVQVARLAGLPEAVVSRARDILSSLEEGARGARPAALLDELPLFAARPQAKTPPPSPLQERLAAVDPDALSPREALDLIYELAALANQPPS